MRGRETQAHEFPLWVKAEGIYAASSHEPLKFYRRIGNNPEWREQWYYAHRTEEFAREMADAGFNHVNFAFFKGFGLEEEREEIDDLAKRIPVFHKHGIKVRAYIQFGSLMYETFLKEVPEARDWCRRDPQGRIITYRWGNLYWRWRPCHSKPGFRAYLKKCVDRAIEIGVDAIGFDNVKQGWGGDYHDFCYCETCRSLFRSYLVNNLAGRADLIGISTFENVEPPLQHHVNDVICQAWARFQDERLRDNVREMYEYAKSKKPDVLINTNGLPAHVSGDSTDTSTWEGHYSPRIENDEIICGAHAYKHGNDRDIYVYASVVAPEFSEEDLNSPESAGLRTMKLGVACATAFGGHGVFVPAIMSKMRGAKFPLDAPAFAETCRRYFGFLRQHRRLFYPLESAANVAIYLNWPSWTLDRERVTPVHNLVEQLFIRHHVLFDIFYLRPPESLRKYDLLVFPEIRCMSDRELGDITKFIQAGGAVLSLGQTCQCDEHFRERRAAGLTKALSHGGQKVKSLRIPHEALEPGGWRTFGSLIEVARDLLGEKGLPIEFDAPDTLAVDAYRIRGTGKSTVSLLNFDPDQKAKAVVLRLSGKRFGDVKRAWCASPDSHSAELSPLPVKSDLEVAAFTVPEVDIFSIVVTEGSASRHGAD